MKRVTAAALRGKKELSQKITMLTAYDATMAALFDRAGIDALLVGDSLGMVVQGHQSTLPVTLEHMIYHTQAVLRGAQRAHVVSDMPFMSYQVSVEEALRNAGRLMQEGGAHAVKLEGGREIVGQVEALVRAGIPVMGHIGLKPQHVHATGGYKVQGNSLEDAQDILADAQALEAAGVYAVVLECVPAELAAVVTRRLSVPTIGIGAGAAVDGQVLVGQDLLGLNPEFKPTFVRRFAELGVEVQRAVEDYREAVASEDFPSARESFRAPTDLEGEFPAYGALTH